MLLASVSYKASCLNTTKLVVTPLYGSDKIPAIDKSGNDVSQTFNVPDWSAKSVYDTQLSYNRIRVSDALTESGYALYVAEGIDVDPSKELTAIRFESAGARKRPSHTITGGEKVVSKLGRMRAPAYS